MVREGQGSGSVRPGPPARVVGRGRVTAVLGWCLMIVLGLGLLTANRSGDVVAVVVGAFLALTGLFCLIITLRYRVWIDHPYLIVRQLWGRYRSIRLDQLTGAFLWGATGPTTSRNLVLHDGHGDLSIPPMLFRLNRLYGALGAYIDPNRSVANEELCQKIRRHTTEPHWY